MSEKSKNIQYIFSVYSAVVLGITAVLISASVFFYSKRNSNNAEIKLNTIKTVNDASEIKNDIENKIFTLKIMSEFFVTDFVESQNTEQWKKFFSNPSLKKIILLKAPKIVTISDTITKNISTDTIYYKSAVYEYKKGGIILNEINGSFENEINLLLYSKIKKQKSVFIAEPEIQKFSDSQISLTKLFIPVYSPDNEFLGIIGACFNTDKIFEIINRRTSDAKNIKIILTQNKNIVAITDKPWLSEININNLQTDEKFLFEKINPNQIQGKVENYLYNVSVIKPQNSDNYWKLYSFTSNESFSKQGKNTFIYIFVWIIILFTAIFFITRYFTKKFREKLTDIAENSNKLYTGQPLFFQDNIEIDELNQINKSLKAVYKKYIDNISISNKILESNYTFDNDNYDDTDELSLSVKKIIKKISSLEEQRKQENENRYKEEWSRNGLAEIAKVQNFVSAEIQIFGQNLIKTLVKYCNAVFGGFYINNFNNSKIIELVSSYAFSSEKYIKKSFTSGEGLVGACVFAKKKIEITKVPENYLNVSSGIGSSLPGYIIILPVIWQNDVIGVIELAFVTIPEKYKIDFLEQTSENIASSLNTALMSLKTVDLLEKSQQQTEALHNKELQLNEKISELEKIQLEYDLHTKEMQSMLSAVNNTVLSIEYTPDGELLTANDLYLKTMGFSLEDISGKSVYELLKADQLQELEDTIETVKKGKQLQKTIERFTKSGEKKILWSTYTPYFDNDGKVSRIIYFGFDITQLVNKQ